MRRALGLAAALSGVNLTLALASCSSSVARRPGIHGLASSPRWGRTLSRAHLIVPGFPPSYVPSSPLTPQVVADALAETLSRANIGSRFLLVGHTIGGLNLRLFGASYADLVAATMFLDPTVPSSVTSNPSFEAEVSRLAYDPQATEREGDAVTSWSSGAPILVLSHDPARAVDAGAFSPSDEAIWDEGQKAYARLTSRGTQADVTGASHYVFVDAPEVVVSAIQGLLQAARRAVSTRPATDGDARARGRGT